jgi:hypothetical protein
MKEAEEEEDEEEKERRPTSQTQEEGRGVCYRRAPGPLILREQLAAHTLAPRRRREKQKKKKKKKTDDDRLKFSNRSLYLRLRRGPNSG